MSDNHFYQNNSFFLKFLLNNKNILADLNNKNYEYKITAKNNNDLISEKTGSVLKLIFFNKVIRLKFSLNELKCTHHNNSYNNINDIRNYNFFFYSHKIYFNLLSQISKYNYTRTQITSLNFYLNIKKYFYTFYKNSKKISLDYFTLNTVLDTNQEFIEIKPDKAKKIYFKKKQINTYFSVNDVKNYTSFNSEDLDLDSFKKDIMVKNGLLNLIAQNVTGTNISFVQRIYSNSSISFWKKQNYSQTNLSKIIYNSYYVEKYPYNYVYAIQQKISNNLILSATPLDFDYSDDFEEISNIKALKIDFYKNLFLYNFINLFSKVSNIYYNPKYNYLSHTSEFKDYFYKKINPFSRDLIIKNYKNQNKFNNFFPLYCISYKKFKKLILFSKKQQSPAYSAYYMYYLVNFLELICKKKIWIKINTKKQISDEVYNKFIGLFSKNKLDQISIGKHFFLIEFYEIVYLAFINRDINFFAMWFKKIMEKIHLKKHRKMVKIVHSTIRNNPLFLELTGVKGFSMDIRGKLGTAGNSKKKHYAFTVGSIAPTTKSHGLNLYQTTVRTSTGVLGVTILMSY